MPTSHDAWREELEYLKKIRAENPQLLARANPAPPHELLRRVGITVLPPDLPKGYLRLFPQDFIVEEIDKDGALHAIEPEDIPLQGVRDAKHRTLYCDMIKVGLATNDALDRIAQATGIPRDKISYAGIKDAIAVTAQRIALRDTRYEDVSAVHIPSICLTRFSYGQHIIKIGDLSANRFTIMVRTETPLSQERFVDKLKTVAEQGFYNFYGLQRFGGVRLLSHELGKILCRGEIEETARAFLTACGSEEIPLVQTTRREAADIFPRWDALIPLFERLPYSFRFELAFLRVMVTHPKNFLTGFRAISEQVRLWVYAYASFLFNQKISALVASGSPLPESLPLPLSTEENDRAPYADELSRDGTGELARHLERFPYIALGSRKVAVRVVPKLHRAKVVPEGAMLAFTLPKAAYATTLLMHLFEVWSGMPVPEWVTRAEYDVKAELRIGSVAAIKAVLGKYFVSVGQPVEGGVS